VDAALFLITAAGLGLACWRALRPAPGSGGPTIDESLDLAIHAAMNEARTRGHSVEPAHLLYGLLQDEELRAQTAKVGADVGAIERRIVLDLDRRLRSAISTDLLSTKANLALKRAVLQARAEGMPASRADLFASLLKVDPSIAAMCEAGRLRPVDLLFILSHGQAEAELPPAPDGELGVVIVNDHVSTTELVVEVLEKHLGLSHREAVELMVRTHRQGQALVGRFPAAEARERASAAMADARARGYPLLLRLET
jgi:ATP-dependent Clp protease adaptor protein ClpS